MSDILVFAEQSKGKVKKTTHELLSKASELASQAGGQVVAVCAGDDLAGVSEDLASFGASKVVLVKGSHLADYNTTAYTQALAATVDQVKPSIILGAASDVGKDLFPRLAARIKAGLASDVTDLRVDGGKLVATKPVYSGKAFVDVNFNSDIQMATVRPNSFGAGDETSGASAETVEIAADAGALSNAIVEKQEGAAGAKADLTEAEIIISGGRAMGNEENFKVLRECADVLGATVGASRAAVDSGYASHDMQVGQTGKVVNPKLYVACGISGAIQHLAGMRTSKVIVAINKDPEAPIFSKADYGIVGDLFEVVPALTEELKKVMA